MKFRNHFVTNSSSSSFVAVLSLEFADGKKAELVYDRDFFEDLEIRLSFGDRCVYAEEGDIPHHLDETELAVGQWHNRDQLPVDDDGISLTREMIRVFGEGKEPK